MTKYEVVREHGTFRPGDLREGRSTELGHLVPNCLVPASDAFVIAWQDKQAAIEAAKPTKEWSEGDPRQDGPTVEEYVEHGYFAANYPPPGYASKSTQEEIDAAINAQSTKREQDHANKMEQEPISNKTITEGDGDEEGAEGAQTPAQRRAARKARNR